MHLAIDRKTAGALGLTIPQPVLLRAEASAKRFAMLQARTKPIKVGAQFHWPVRTGPMSRQARTCL